MSADPPFGFSGDKTGQIRRKKRQLHPNTVCKTTCVGRRTSGSFTIIVTVQPVIDNAQAAM